MVGSHVDGFPRAFGPYLLLASFGRGGMGEVFLAKRRVLQDVDRLCVVKTIRGDLAENREYVGRFLDEARVAVQLNHAHICQVYEALRVGNDHCMAMEYVPGVNLRELVHDVREANRHLDWGVAFYLIEALLDALAFAHALTSPITGQPLRIVHRDVSPANVMIGFDGEVKLIDFGLAESVLKREHTETRLVMGKVGYMAPEQARGDEVDGRADQFSAAVVLTELLLGERYYGDFNAHQIWQVVGIGGFRPARYHVLPEPICAVLDRALAPRATERFATCEDFCAALAELRALHAPRAGKQQLRELMRGQYGAKAATLRELVARHAALRAPDDSAPLDSTSPVRPSGAVNSSGTDQWATSPSAPSGGPIDPRAPTTRAVAVATEPTLPAPAVSAPRDPGTSTLARAVSQGRHQATVAAIGGALALVAVGAVVLWPRPAARVDVDAGAIVVAVAHDAGSAVPVEVAPVDATPDAVVDAAAPATTSTDAGSPTLKPATRRGRATKHDTPALPALPELAPATDPLVENTTTAPAPVPSLDDDLALVQRCQRQCAVELRSLLAGKESDPRARVASEPLIRRCAKSCRGG